AHAPLGANAVTILPGLHDGVTVWTGNDPTVLDAAQIGGIVGEPGLALFYDAGFGNARIGTNGGGSAEALDRQVVFTAVQSGVAGHDITVRLFNPGVADSPLSVSVAGRAITISLATNSGGAL